jgi:hypothetical protein
MKEEFVIIRRRENDLSIVASGILYMCTMRMDRANNVLNDGNIAMSIEELPIYVKWYSPNLSYKKIHKAINELLDKRYIAYAKYSQEDGVIIVNPNIAYGAYKAKRK